MPNDMKLTLKITGMHCGSCKNLIEDVCGETAGVKSCAVDLGMGLAEIEADDGLDLPALIREISELDDYRVEQV